MMFVRLFANSRKKQYFYKNLIVLVSFSAIYRINCRNLSKNSQNREKLKISFRKWSKPAIFWKKDLFGVKGSRFSRNYCKKIANLYFLRKLLLSSSIFPRIQAESPRKPQNYAKSEWGGATFHLQAGKRAEVLDFR